MVSKPNLCRCSHCSSAQSSCVSPHCRSLFFSLSLVLDSSVVWSTFQGNQRDLQDVAHLFCHIRHKTLATVSLQWLLLSLGVAYPGFSVGVAYCRLERTRLDQWRAKPFDWWATLDSDFWRNCRNCSSGWSVLMSHLRREMGCRKRVISCALKWSEAFQQNTSLYRFNY